MESEKKGDIKLIIESALKFISSDLFYDLCFEFALDSNRIFEGFVAGTKKQQSAIAVPTEMYLRITKFVIGQYLITIEQLPSFEKSTLKAVLKDTDELLDRVRSIEFTLTDIRSSIVSDNEKSEFEYRRIVSRKFKNIHLFGLDTLGLPKQYDLSIAYVNLLAEDSSSQTVDSTETLLAKALSEDGRLVLVQGEHGSGKTTLLSWLALKAARNDLPVSMARVRQLLPVFIRLREFANQQLPEGISILDQQLGAAKDNVDESWKLKKLKSGEFLLLVDGLDELPSQSAPKPLNGVMMS